MRIYLAGLIQKIHSFFLQKIFVQLLLSALSWVGRKAMINNVEEIHDIMKLYFSGYKQKHISIQLGKIVTILVTVMKGVPPPLKRM